MVYASTNLGNNVWVSIIMLRFHKRSPSFCLPIDNSYYFRHDIVMGIKIQAQCACGCNETIFIKPYLAPSEIKIRGLLRFKAGHQNRGKIHTPEHKEKSARKLEQNGRWNGGRIVDKNGYILIKNREHPYSNNCGYVREHRLIMEKHLGRFLAPDEVVHHINHIPNDNRIENLELHTDHSEHIRNCRKGRKFPRESGIWLTCQRCNKYFYKSNHWKKNPPRYCSWSCRYPLQL